MSVLKLSKSNFDSEVVNSDIPVLIDFYANWCGPCRMLSPIIENIANEATNLKVCKVNVDEEPELAQLFEVASIPLLAIVKDGVLVDKAVGYRPKSAILSMIEGAVVKK
jgi:thioredoxin 1